MSHRPSCQPIIVPWWIAWPIILGCIAVMLMVSGCDRYFADPYIDQLESPTATDIHLQSNRHWPPNNETCLPNAHHKARYMREYGFDPRLVAIQLHNSTDTHAFVVVDGMVYDNGFMSEVPFPLSDVSHYGRIVPWQAEWGRES